MMVLREIVKCTVKSSTLFLQHAMMPLLVTAGLLMQMTTMKPSACRGSAAAKVATASGANAMVARTAKTLLAGESWHVDNALFQSWSFVEAVILSVKRTMLLYGPQAVNAKQGHQLTYCAWSSTANVLKSTHAYNMSLV